MRSIYCKSRAILALAALLLLAGYPARATALDPPGTAPAPPPPSATISAQSDVSNDPGSGQVTYQASIDEVDPAVNSEQKITQTEYQWTGNCDPSDSTTTNSTTVTVSATKPGDVSSTVSCTVTWTIHDNVTNTDSTVPVDASAVTTTAHFGVLWTPGGWGGGVLKSPQDLTGATPAPLYVFASPSKAGAFTKAASVNKRIGLRVA